AAYSEGRLQRAIGQVACQRELRILGDRGGAPLHNLAVTLYDHAVCEVVTALEVRVDRSFLAKARVQTAVDVQARQEEGGARVSGSAVARPGHDDAAIAL